MEMSSPWRIMVIDDDSAQLKILSTALRAQNYQVQTYVESGTALTELESFQPHLLILDVNMPGLNGFQTLRRLRERKQYLSVIFLSGQSDIENVVKGLELGADDYLTKPYDLRELIARVHVQLRLNRLRQELKAANEQLQLLIELDDLTGLYNMRSMYDRLDQALARAQRYQRQVAAVMVDMDHFKSVNDQHDHLFGSFVLSQVGHLIKEGLRKTDFAARYGGDEFLLVLTETKEEGLHSFCERLREKVKNHEFIQGPHHTFQTVSLGATITSTNFLNVDARELVRQADKALYQAKDRGRDCVVITHFLETAHEK